MSHVRIKREDLERAALRRIGRFEYPDGEGLLFQAEAFPRLSLLTRSWKASSRKAQFWLVDGRVVTDFDEAVARINEPPSLTADELELLKILPRDWTLPGDFRRGLLTGLAREERRSRRLRLRSLQAKGFLEVEAHRLRRRPGLCYQPAEPENGPHRIAGCQ